VEGDNNTIFSLYMMIQSTWDHFYPLCSTRRPLHHDVCWSRSNCPSQTI